MNNEEIEEEEDIEPEVYNLTYLSSNPNEITISPDDSLNLLAHTTPHIMPAPENLRTSFVATAQSTPYIDHHSSPSPISLHHPTAHTIPLSTSHHPTAPPSSHSIAFPHSQPEISPSTDGSHTFHPTPEPTPSTVSIGRSAIRASSTSYLASEPAGRSIPHPESSETALVTPIQAMPRFQRRPRENPYTQSN